jgi:hypothetical protein
MTNWKISKYKKTTAITEEDYKWLEKNRGKKSRAGFLEYIINCFKQQTLF